MKVIPTVYRGFLFRSRLEARWAVFMDTMDVKFVYEPEGYDLDGLWYLPDFWLPQMKAHLEIKPDTLSAEEQEKATRLATFSKLPVFVMEGQPECPTDSNWYHNESQATLALPSEGKDGRGDIHYIWCECPHCHRCELQFDGRADRINCKCPKSEHGGKGYNFDSPRLIEAYSKAKSYRFEA